MLIVNPIHSFRLGSGKDFDDRTKADFEKFTKDLDDKLKRSNLNETKNPQFKQEKQQVPST